MCAVYVVCAYAYEEKYSFLNDVPKRMYKVNMNVKERRPNLQKKNQVIKYLIITKNK